MSEKIIDRTLRTENHPFQTTHCHLTVSLQRIPANIHKNFISPETRVSGLLFCRWKFQ